MVPQGSVITIQEGIVMREINDIKRQTQPNLKGFETATNKSDTFYQFQHSEVAAALNKIYDHLGLLLEELHLQQNGVLASCEIGNICKLVNLLQQEYRVFAETTFHHKTLGLTFINVCEKRCQVTDIKTDDREHLRHELKHFGLDVVRQADDKVEVEGKFSSSIVFSTNYHDNKISLEIKNIENTAPHVYELDPSSITDNFFDEFDSFVLHDENAFIRHIKVQENASAEEYYEQSVSQDELPMTAVMEAPLLRELFSNQRRLFLTYHEKIKEVRSDDDGILIGRGTSSDLLVPSELASRKHARIVYRKGKFVVSDHSTNGTFIKSQNGKEVYIHGEDYPLTGSGFISLGESTALDNDHLIYFSCQES
jgi:hypothetical protein